MPVLRERRGKTEIITINRPEVRNAINGETSKAMSEALDACEEDDEILAVVITGAGDKSFSAGMDLKAFATGEGADVMGGKGGFAGIAQRDFPKPIIAAVNGTAQGGGFEIMISCDLVVAAEHATFGIPEVKRGIAAGAGGLIRIAKRIPLPIALEMAMTGDPIDTTRALQLGLINRVVPAEKLIDEAVALAEKICENGPLAVQVSKKLVRQAMEMPEEQAWDLNMKGLAEVFTSEDAREGPLAFAQKRKPQWKGR